MLWHRMLSWLTPIIIIKNVIVKLGLAVRNLRPVR